jgi:CBS domain-containing protein
MSQRNVGQLIKRKVVYLPSSTNVSDASKVMATKHIGAVLVMDDGQLEGIFTERDAVIRVLAKRRDSEATQLSEVMTRDPITIAPQSAATDALRLMSGPEHQSEMRTSGFSGAVKPRSGDAGRTQSEEGQNCASRTALQ